MEVLSFGAGVQSSALILLALEGRHPKPDLVVFADTGSERPRTYETVKQISRLCRAGGVEFVTVQCWNDEDGKVPDRLHVDYRKRETLPMIGQAICTVKWKIRPVRRCVRARLPCTGPKPWAKMWLGITTDEIHRKRESDVQYLENRFPLIEMGWTRQDCIGYLAENYPWLKIEKSGCFMCPYQSRHGWSSLRGDHPELFEVALELDRAGRMGKHNLKGLFRSRESLEQFNHSHTLADFGFEIDSTGFDDCEGQGGCFL
jgi:3'-phosphoadenosine 5'-phosphosulfate sulfotransferase (PAPS reductase)/FAD synthetase|tara:strand:- start:1828 stop:2604 length:777 start_codon:yes stop_codon:yes gene_type:complete